MRCNDLLELYNESRPDPGPRHWIQRLMQHFLPSYGADPVPRHRHYTGDVDQHGHCPDFVDIHFTTAKHTFLVHPDDWKTPGESFRKHFLRFRDAIEEVLRRDLIANVISGREAIWGDDIMQQLYAMHLAHVQEGGGTYDTVVLGSRAYRAFQDAVPGSPPLYKAASDRAATWYCGRPVVQDNTRHRVMLLDTSSIQVEEEGPTCSYIDTVPDGGRLYQLHWRGLLVSTNPTAHAIAGYLREGE